MMASSKVSRKNKRERVSGSGLLAAFLGLFFVGSVFAEESRMFAKRSLDDGVEPTRPFVELEGPSETPQAQFVQTLLETAYDKIGYDVRYRRVPLARSFVEANAGRLDGLRARVGTVADEYENLIKIPYNILDFNVVILGDRRLCGLCGIEDVENVVTIRGFRALNSYLKTQPNVPSLTEVTNMENVYPLLLSGKFPAAIMPDTNIPDEVIRANPHLVKRTLVTLPDYHYLHKKHADLIPSLHNAILELDAIGAVSQLRQQYGIPRPTSGILVPVLANVSALSGNWHLGNRDRPDYLAIVASSFESEGVTLSSDITSWNRAHDAFHQGEVDMLIGVKGDHKDQDAILSDMHIDYSPPLYAYGKSETRLSNLFDEKQTGNLCFESGHDMNLDTLRHLSVYEVDDVKTCFNLLLADKVDVVLEHAENVNQAMFERESLVTKRVKESLPLFVMFRNSERGRALKQRFENGFDALVRQGNVARYFPNDVIYQRAHLALSETQRAP